MQIRDMDELQPHTLELGECGGLKHVGSDMCATRGLQHMSRLGLYGLSRAQKGGRGTVHMATLYA